jgi:flagellar biosynthesis protein FlhF
VQSLPGLTEGCGTEDEPSACAAAAPDHTKPAAEVFRRREHRTARAADPATASASEAPSASTASATALAGASVGRGPRAGEAAPSGPERQLAAEIRILRGMVEEQMAGFAWGELQRREPAAARLLRQMLAAGFSPALARHLLDHLPNGLGNDAAAKWLMAALTRNLLTPDTEEAMVNQGGVYALIGPTGVGKTTTTAKIAARAVVRFGAERVALLTTDGYRIGGHEQLRIYGKLLGIPVHGVKDLEDLNGALSDLAHKHLVLIDTVGMSQRDQAVAEQVALLTHPGTPVRRVLLLNATSNAETLEEVINVYRASGLAGCIITKTDEAVSLGTALDAAIRHQLALQYIATGQRVPEDLHPGNRHYLIHRVFRQVPRAPSPFALTDGEMGMVLARPGRRGALNLELEGASLG